MVSSLRASLVILMAVCLEACSAFGTFASSPRPFEDVSPSIECNPWTKQARTAPFIIAACLLVALGHEDPAARRHRRRVA